MNLINNIVIFKGVFYNDLLQTDKKRLTTREFIESLKIESIQTYSSIPKKFTSVEDWPKMTNLHCWNCDRTFSSYPKFIPKNPETIYINGKLETHWDPEGNFCEWNCVIDWIRSRLPQNRQWDAEQDTCTVAGKFSHKKIVRIMPSPQKTMMKHYCGENGISEKQYQELINRLNTDYDLTSYKLEHFKESD